MVWLWGRRQEAWCGGALWGRLVLSIMRPESPASPAGSWARRHCQLQNNAMSRIGPVHTLPARKGRPACAADPAWAAGQSTFQVGPQTQLAQAGPAFEVLGVQSRPVSHSPRTKVTGKEGQHGRKSHQAQNRRPCRLGMSGCCALTPPPTRPVYHLGQASPLPLTSGHPHFMT